MDNFPEESIPFHIQGHQFKKVITAVLQHHTMLFGPLRSFHQLPTFLQSFCGGYFHGGMFSRFHGINCHRRMPIPRRGDINEIQIASVHHLFPGIDRTGITFRFVSGIFQLGFHFIHPFRNEVTNRLDLNPFDLAQPIHSTWTTLSKSNNANPYCIQFRSCITAHVELLIM